MDDDLSKERNRLYLKMLLKQAESVAEYWRKESTKQTVEIRDQRAEILRLKRKCGEIFDEESPAADS